MMEIDAQIKRAQERVAKLNQRKARVEAQAELARRKAELTQAVHKAVKEALNGLKLDIPPEGFAFYVHKGDNGGLLLDVKIGKGSGNNKKSISALGPSGFVLPDGSKVSSATAVLDHFGVPHKGDSAARLILRFARENPDKAKGVTVQIGKEKVPLTEAVKRI